MDMKSIVYGNSTYVCVVQDGTTIHLGYGTNKNSFNTSKNIILSNFIKLIYFKNLFIVLYYNSYRNRYQIERSSDGITWTVLLAGSYSQLVPVRNRLFACSNGGTIFEVNIDNATASSIATIGNSMQFMFAADEVSDYPLCIARVPSDDYDVAYAIMKYNGSTFENIGNLPHIEGDDYWNDAICENGRIILSTWKS